jgi:hypothetical protein
MALDLGKSKEARKCLSPLDPNVAVQIVSKRQREKLGRVSQTLKKASWTLDDFHRNLKLSNTHIDPCRSLNSNLVAHGELKKVFGKQEQNGFKPKPNEHLIVVYSNALLKLYKTVYAHPLDNGQYFTIFLKGCLAHCNSHKVNWTQYMFMIVCNCK